MQGAECAAVIIYRKQFRNAAGQVKAFRPKGDNLPQQCHQNKKQAFSMI